MGKVHGECGSRWEKKLTKQETDAHPCHGLQRVSDAFHERIQAVGKDWSSADQATFQRSSSGRAVSGTHTMMARGLKLLKTSLGIPLRVMATDMSFSAFPIPPSAKRKTGMMKKTAQAA